MSTTKPIKSIEQVRKLKKYYIEKEEYRNFLLVSVCLNTALRISDILMLKWENVINISTKQTKKYLRITETKTGKKTNIIINRAIKDAIKVFIEKEGIESEFMFSNRNGKPITRENAYYIVKKAGISIGLEHEISPHSLRKTFGYHAWKKGVPPAMLVELYNHSSYEVTKRYLGIDQDEKDRVFMDVAL